MKTRHVIAVVLACVAAIGASAEPESGDTAASCTLPPGSIEKFLEPMAESGLDAHVVADKITFLSSLIADPDTPCGTSGIALLLLTGEKLGNPDPEGFYPAFKAALAHELFVSRDGPSLRGRLVSFGVLHALITGTADTAYSLLEGDADILMKPAREDRYLYAQFLAVVGQADQANSLAERVLLDRGGRKKHSGNLFPVSRPDPRAVAELSGAFKVFLLTGAADEAVEYLANMDVEESGFNEKVIALSLIPKTADPARSLDRLSLSTSDLVAQAEDGYMSPENAEVVTGLMIAAERAAGREADASARLRAAQKTFGKSFDPVPAIESLLDAMRDVYGYAPVEEISDAEALAPIQPNWPWEVEPGEQAICLVRFNVSAAGKPINISSKCSDERFTKSAENSIKRATFAPTRVNGKPVVRYNVVQEMEYR